MFRTRCEDVKESPKKPDACLGALVAGEPGFARGDAYSAIVREATATKEPTFIGIPYASTRRHCAIAATP
jgi:hypothetical protein